MGPFTALPPRGLRQSPAQALGTAPSNPEYRHFMAACAAQTAMQRGAVRANAASQVSRRPVRQPHRFPTTLRDMPPPSRMDHFRLQTRRLAIRILSGLQHMFPSNRGNARRRPAAPSILPRHAYAAPAPWLIPSAVVAPPNGQITALRAAIDQVLNDRGRAPNRAPETDASETLVNYNYWESFDGSYGSF